MKCYKNISLYLLVPIVINAADIRRLKDPVIIEQYTNPKNILDLPIDEQVTIAAQNDTDIQSLKNLVAFLDSVSNLNNDKLSGDNLSAMQKYWQKTQSFLVEKLPKNTQSDPELLAAIENITKSLSFNAGIAVSTSRDTQITMTTKIFNN